MPPTPSKKTKRRGVRIGKYEIIKHIATGGMGAVYRARDSELNREVALKVLAPECATDTLIERFKREARSAAKLRHENVVTVFEFGESAGTHYLAMEFVDGIDLYEYVSKKGKLHPDETRKLLKQACRALMHAHAQNIVHRDIKPSNFLVASTKGRTILKLTDMGLARETTEDEFRLTSAGSTVGTVDYMSPEQARNSASADIRSDIYSLGCTAFHLLTGNPPFSEGSLTERIFKHIQDEPPDIRKMNPSVSPAFVAVILRMIAKKREDRFQTPDEVLAALDKIKNNETTTAPAPADEPTILPDIHDSRLASLQELADEEAAGTVEVHQPAKTDSAVRTPVPAPKPERKPKSSPKTQAKPKSAPEQPKRRKRYRDGEVLKSNRKSKHIPAPVDDSAMWKPWIYVGAGVVVLLAIAVVVSVVPWETLFSNTNGDKQAQPNPPKQKTSDTSKKNDPPDKQPKPRRGVFQPIEPIDAVQLRKQIDGPHHNAVFPQSQRTITVSRAQRDDCAHTIADALARAPANSATTIALQDNGPLFAQSLPVIANKTIIIQGKTGYRPILAWDFTATDKTNKTPLPFIRVEDSTLVLKNIDIVIHGNAETMKQAFDLFLVKQSNFVMEGCSVTTAGKQPTPVTVVHFVSTRKDQLCRMDGCVMRGSKMTAVQLAGTGGDVLIRNSLLVNSHTNPLLDVTSTTLAATVRIRKSTLICGHTLMQVRASSAMQAPAGVAVHCCDALLADNKQADTSRMVDIGNTPTKRIQWHAVNCLYTGWAQLLLSDTQSIRGTHIKQWRKQWNYATGDKAIGVKWPPNYRAQPENTTLAEYQPTTKDVHFDAFSDDGVLGCAVATLVQPQAHLLARTFGEFDSPPIILPVPKIVALIPQIKDDKIHGGEITLDKTSDLGKIITDILAQNVAPRVVLHVNGSGTHYMSPFVVRDTHLEIYCIARKGTKPLVLYPKSSASADKEALIDVDNGGLTLHNARIMFYNKGTGINPAVMIKLRTSDLTLTRCRLKGRMDGTQKNFAGLIDVGGGQSADKAQKVRIQECVVQSSKRIIHIRNPFVHMRAKGTLFFARGDAFHVHADSLAKQVAIRCVFDKNTIAARDNVFVVRVDKHDADAVPILIRAHENLFFAPFKKALNHTCLLQCTPELIERGALQWRGVDNGFDDKHLHAYVLHGPYPKNMAQSFATWTALWGRHGEHNPLRPDLPDLQFDHTPQFLHKLNNRAVRPGVMQDPPGADFRVLKLLP